MIVDLDESADDPVQVELAWEEEIHRRLAAYQRGEVQTIPSADVFAKAWALLARRTDRGQ
jgi:Putative addiction module component